MIIKKRLRDIYDKTYSHFGPQHWWPGETPFEVIIGVILTQNTSWINVEKAIRNLKKDNLLDYKRMNKISEERLAELIKPAGYYNLKARRIKNFLNFLLFSCGGDLKKIMRKDKNKLRQDLLSVNGIGPESADSILLYAFNKPFFVVDAYTKRIFSRHGFIKEDDTYDKIQGFFMRNLNNDARLFNEYHALLVKTAKDFCLRSQPKCDFCPLKVFNERNRHV